MSVAGRRRAHAPLPSPPRPLPPLRLPRLQDGTSAAGSVRGCPSRDAWELHLSCALKTRPTPSTRYATAPRPAPASNTLSPSLHPFTSSAAPHTGAQTLPAPPPLVSLTARFGVCSRLRCPRCLHAPQTAMESSRPHGPCGPCCPGAATAAVSLTRFEPPSSSLASGSRPSFPSDPGGCCPANLRHPAPPHGV